jgi:hypothetical protein
MVEVVKLHPGNDPDEVLMSAIGVYDSVIILGWAKDNTFSGRSSLNLEIADVVLLLELFKATVLAEAVE